MDAMGWWFLAKPVMGYGPCIGMIGIVKVLYGMTFWHHPSKMRKKHGRHYVSSIFRALYDGMTYSSLPLLIGSMYGILTYIYHKNQPNVGKYTIHGSYGLERCLFFFPLNGPQRLVSPSHSLPVNRSSEFPTFRGWFQWLKTADCHKLK